MLVLSRKLNEKIYIGDDVVLTVTAIESNRVKIGIEAPRSVRVLRPEMLEKEPVQKDPSSPNTRQGL